MSLFTVRGIGGIVDDIVSVLLLVKCHWVLEMAVVVCLLDVNPHHLKIELRPSQIAQKPKRIFLLLTIKFWYLKIN